MFALALRSDPYPQKRDWQDLSWLDRVGESWRIRATSTWQLRASRRQQVVAWVEEWEPYWAALSADELALARTQLRRDLTRAGLDDDRLVAKAFGLVRMMSRRMLGMGHFSTQIEGAFVLLHGNVAEMNTGEGKSLTATLAAATAALSGMKVHVVTVNDYLAERDAAHFGPLYEALGLRCTQIGEQTPPADKAQLYAGDIVYCNNKTLVFDYLRDRLTLGERTQPLRLAMDLMTGRTRQPQMQGLQFAIVDEADSVFVDEARTPLIISATRRSEEAEAFFREAIDLARKLVEGQDYELAPRDHHATLTQDGREHLRQLTQDEQMSPVWQSPLRAEEAVLLALQALHAFIPDVHYIVREGKVMIVDENTGRVMPDRSWERGLQQLIEVKEGVELSAEKETMGRISYQMFFRRYLRLSGMTGTCKEVAKELADVYGLGVVKIAPYKPTLRQALPAKLYATSEQRWAAVIERIRDVVATGRPVLVGTRSIAASEALSHLLTLAGVAHQVLNAKQDQAEAELVAAAGEGGCVTIATNMAGRGTDIKLSDEVCARGGLHVIITEGHDSSRIDRQLAGRCGRMGDPGSWEAMLSMDDTLVSEAFPMIRRRLLQGLTRPGMQRASQKMGLTYYKWVQRRVERAHALVRHRLLRSDFSSRQALSFTGKME